MFYLACLLAGSVQAAEPALQWLQQRAVADDEQALQASLMRPARIIAFGEAQHGDNDFLRVRNRWIQAGIEHYGVTAIAAETGFAESAAINDYVLGKASLTPALVRDVFTFGAPAVMPANQELLEWLRAYNARKEVKRKVRFYGIEMLGRYDRTAQRHARPPFDAALAFVRARDAALGRSWEQRFEPLLSKLTSTGYGSFSAQERDALTLASADFVRVFERRRVEWTAASSRESFERAWRNARNAQNLDADLRVGGWWMPDGKEPNQRDASSAETVRWILQQEGRDGRVFLFAHNLHVRKCAQEAGRKPFSSLGENLRLMSADPMVVIGAVPAAGGAGTVNALMAQAGRPAYALDLRAAPPGSWWRQPQRWDDYGSYRVFTPAACFDALIYSGS